MVADSGMGDEELRACQHARSRCFRVEHSACAEYQRVAKLVCNLLQRLDCPGTVMVISADRMPPRWMASIDRMADSAEEVRTTGTTPISRIDERICCLFITFRVSGRPLPIDHAAVVLVVAFLVSPVVTDLVRQGVFVELDAQARARWAGRDSLRAR